MKKIGLLILLVAFAGLGCAARRDAMERGAGARVKAAALLPARGEVVGWKPEGKVRVFGGKQIYDYINGAGEVFLRYDFKEVAAAEYESESGELIGVDVYDMGSPEEAFGIYTYSRYVGCELVNVGEEGFITETSLDFWKGSFHVKVQAFQTSAGTMAGMRKLADQIAGKVVEEGWNPPSIFELLPAEKRVPQSEKFFHDKLILDNLVFISEENRLDLSPKTDCAWAEYEEEGKQAKVLLIRYASANEAMAVVSELIGAERVPVRGAVGEIRGLKLADEEAALLFFGQVVRVLWTDSEALEEWLTSFFIQQAGRGRRGEDSELAELFGV